MFRTCLFGSERLLQNNKRSQTLYLVPRPPILEQPETLCIWRFSGRRIAGGHPWISSRIYVGSLGPLEPWFPAKRRSSVQKVKQILRVTNPWQHSLKMTADVFSPHGTNIRLVFAPDVLWIGGTSAKSPRRFRALGSRTVAYLRVPSPRRVPFGYQTPKLEVPKR